MIPAEIVQFFLIALFLTLWVMERGKRVMSRQDAEALAEALDKERDKTATLTGALRACEQQKGRPAFAVDATRVLRELRGLVATHKEYTEGRWVVPINALAPLEDDLTIYIKEKK